MQLVNTNNKSVRIVVHKVEFGFPTLRMVLEHASINKGVVPSKLPSTSLFPSGDNPLPGSVFGS